MRRAVILVGLATLLGCSKSSTGPSDPLVGTWNVTLPTFLSDSTYFTPSPVTLTIAKTPAGTYTATYPDLVYHYPNSGVIDTYKSVADSSSFSGAGDSVQLNVGAQIASCVMTLRGTLNGSTGTGKYWVHFGCGPSGADTATWSAQKQ